MYYVFIVYLYDLTFIIIQIETKAYSYLVTTQQFMRDVFLPKSKMQSNRLQKYFGGIEFISSIALIMFIL